MIQASISVIIPTYNSSRTILRALDSVLKQTCSFKEIVIIDDASEDETYSIIENFIHTNNQISIILLKNSQNYGPSVSRNKGIEISTGEWIAFLDSDDFWHPQKLEIQFNLANRMNIDFIGSKFSFKLDSAPFSLITEPEFTILTQKDFLWKNHFSTPTVFVRRSKDLVFDESMRFSEDYKLWLNLISKSKQAILIQDPLAFLGKRAYGDSGLSSHLLRMEMGEIKVLLSEKNKLLRVLAVTYSILKFLRRLVINTVYKMSHKSI
jgi:hypothetical protein